MPERQSDHEFMLDEKLLAAPVVTKGMCERKVVFPEDRWQTLDGQVYEGGTAPVLPAPLDTLLLLFLQKLLLCDSM